MNDCFAIIQNYYNLVGFFGIKLSYLPTMLNNLIFHPKILRYERE